MTEIFCSQRSRGVFCRRAIKNIHKVLLKSLHSQCALSEACGGSKGWVEGPLKITYPLGPHIFVFSVVTHFAEDPSRPITATFFCLFLVVLFMF